MEKVMYQPILSKKEWETGKLPSFGVYHSLKKAKEDYPNHIISAYLDGEIEEPTFMDNDETAKENAIKSAEHYLSDSEELTIIEQIELIATRADEGHGDDLIDNIDGVVVWEKLEGEFNCDEFLEMIGWDLI